MLRGRPLKALLAVPRWPPPRSSHVRPLSTTAWLRAPLYTEHVHVPCASAGHVTISLHDLERHPATAPVLINLPAFPVQDLDDVDSYLPRALHRYPGVTIHYRWPQQSPRPSPSSSSSSSSSPGRPTRGKDPPPDPEPLCWPTPIHDTLAAYDHLVRDLLVPPPTGDTDSTTSSSSSPRSLRRRDVYVYGSYLGAGLGAALALTEPHTHKPVAVRGLVAINGVYNWTTFLPGHPINDHGAYVAGESPAGDHPGGDPREIARMKALMPSLFRDPADLFDPFASPVLFFHTAGLMVPLGFEQRWSPRDAYRGISALWPGGDSRGEDVPYVYADPDDPPPPPPSYPGLEGEMAWEGTAATMAPAPRVGYLTFPPRESTLQIPDTLLLHTSPPPTPPLPSTIAAGQRRGRAALWRRLKTAENSFGSQAAGLAGLMRRSVNTSERRVSWRRRRRREDEVAGRVATGEIGRGGAEEMARTAEEVAARWLEERLG